MTMYIVVIGDGYTMVLPNDFSDTLYLNCGVVIFSIAYIKTCIVCHVRCFVTEFRYFVGYKVFRNHTKSD